MMRHHLDDDVDDEAQEGCAILQRLRNDLPFAPALCVRCEPSADPLLSADQRLSADHLSADRLSADRLSESGYVLGPRP